MVLLYGMNPIDGICVIAALCECFSSHTTSGTQYIALLMMPFLLSPVDRRRHGRRRHVYVMATTSTLTTQKIRVQLISKDVVALQD